MDLRRDLEDVGLIELINQSQKSAALLGDLVSTVKGQKVEQEMSALRPMRDEIAKELTQIDEEIDIQKNLNGGDMQFLTLRFKKLLYLENLHTCSRYLSMGYLCLGNHDQVGKEIDGSNKVRDYWLACAEQVVQHLEEIKRLSDSQAAAGQQTPWQACLETLGTSILKIQVSSDDASMANQCIALLRRVLSITQDEKPIEFDTISSSLVKVIKKSDETLSLETKIVPLDPPSASRLDYQSMQVAHRVKAYLSDLLMFCSTKVFVEKFPSDVSAGSAFLEAQNLLGYKCPDCDDKLEADGKCRACNKKQPMILCKGTLPISVSVSGQTHIGHQFISVTFKEYLAMLGVHKPYHGIEKEIWWIFALGGVIVLASLILPHC